MSVELAVIPHGSGPQIPTLIAGAGERASWRFVEFFTVNIRNANTRAAYRRAAGAFLAWCEARGIRALAALPRDSWSGRAPLASSVTRVGRG
jgi:hypothetical protein